MINSKGKDKMVWLACDENGNEWIYEYEIPYRNGNEWYARNQQFSELTKGSIFKLTGRNITWADEPVELLEHISHLVKKEV